MSAHQFVIGCSFLFSSILLAKLKEPTSTIKITPEDGSWIGKFILYYTIIFIQQNNQK